MSSHISILEYFMNFVVLNSKRGQEGGGGPATLVIVLILLITLYIMLLPSEDRQELLEDDDDTTVGSSVNIDDNITLLDESPGRLDYLNLDEYDHNLDAFTLYRTTNSEELKKENAFVVRSGWFDKKTKTIRFAPEDLENLDNVMINFIATKYQGILTVTFNGETIFEGAMSRTNLDSPIHINKDIIREDNVVELSVNSVGWQFWTTNEYNIDNFVIIGDMTDISRQESTNVFIMSQTEKENLDKAKLKFNPDCMPSDVGTLDIFINNNKVFGGIPDCGILNTKEFSIRYLEEGENSVVFRTNKGSYIIDQIKVNTKLKDVVYPAYYFEVNSSIFDDIEQDNLDVELKLQFIDDDEYKKVSVYVNSATPYHINEKDADWNRNIDNKIREGTNVIKIEPEAVVDILQITVIASEHN